MECGYETGSVSEQACDSKIEVGTGLEVGYLGGARHRDTLMLMMHFKCHCAGCWLLRRGVTCVRRERVGAQHRVCGASGGNLTAGDGRESTATGGDDSE